MSLNWNIEQVKDNKQVCWLEDGQMNPVTHTLIYSTISVGLGSITDKNLDEFVARFRIIEKLHGPLIWRDGKESLLTDEEITAHVGLYCNVSNETRAQWARRIFVTKQTSITEDYARSFRGKHEKVSA
jgi:hypothetical protein